MPISSDNQFALQTAAGPAAIAVIRVRGPSVADFVAKHIKLRGSRTWPQPAGSVLRALLVEDAADPDQTPLDDILLMVRSGEDACDIELHLHGGVAVVEGAAELLERFGFRALDSAARSSSQFGSADLNASIAFDHPASAIEREVWRALPTMQTRAAVDWLMTQVGAVSQTLLQALAQPSREAQSAALQPLVDLPDWISFLTTPLQIAVVGPPNAGKSALCNALSDRQASLVSDVAGTTRDWVAVRTQLGAFPVELRDTAGWRATEDPLERAGVDAAREWVARANVVVLALSVETDFDEACAVLSMLDELACPPAVVCWTKCDLGAPPSAADQVALRFPTHADSVGTSATARTGLDSFGSAVLAAARCPDPLPIAPTCFSPHLAAVLQDIAAHLVGPSDRPEQGAAALARLLRVSGHPT